MLGKTRFEALKAHYRAHGLERRRHGNLKKAPLNTLTSREKENVVKFLKSYTRANGPYAIVKILSSAHQFSK